MKKSIDNNIEAVECNVNLEKIRQRNEAKFNFNKYKNSAQKQEQEAFLLYYYSDEEMIARKQGYKAERIKLRAQMKGKSFTEKAILVRKILGEHIKGFKDDFHAANFNFKQNLKRSLALSSALTVGVAGATSNVLVNR